ncbi:MAG: hypothetical protein ACC634_02260, partial [Hyphomicrobiales bacterium]
MGTQILLGVGIGLTSFLLYASATQFSALALLLFYLAPLPIMLATLGWGRSVGIVSGVTAWIGVTAAIAPVAGITYLISVAAPSVFLALLAGMSRPVATPASLPATSTDTADKTSTPTPDKSTTGQAWYPLGRLVLWTVLWGIVTSAIALVWFSSGPEGLTGRIRALLDMFVQNPSLPNAQNETPDALDTATIDNIVAMMSRLLFPAVATIWSLTMLGNLWMTGKILLRSKRLQRPWPKIQAMNYPQMTGFAFIAALGATMMPGILGKFAIIIAAGLGLALVLLGLAVVHALTTGLSTRSLVLVAVYSAMVLFAWPALLLAAVGLGELIFTLRARF